MGNGREVGIHNCKIDSPSRNAGFAAGGCHSTLEGEPLEAQVLGEIGRNYGSGRAGVEDRVYHKAGGLLRGRKSHGNKWQTDFGPAEFSVPLEAEDRAARKVGAGSFLDYHA